MGYTSELPLSLIMRKNTNAFQSYRCKDSDQGSSVLEKMKHKYHNQLKEGLATHALPYETVQL
jgi:hypothetical protein